MHEDEALNLPGKPAARTGRSIIESKLRQEIFVQKYPTATAGALIAAEHDAGDYTLYSDAVHADPGNPYVPFSHKLDWEIARWAKLHKVGANTLNALLSINNVCETLNLSYKTSRELNQIIDGYLPEDRPPFLRGEFKIDDSPEVFDLFYRDVVKCVEALYGDAEFARFLVFAPERHYSDVDHTNRMYHDMHTGKWWWTTQVSRTILLVKSELMGFGIRLVWRKTVKLQPQSFQSSLHRTRHKLRSSGANKHTLYTSPLAISRRRSGRSPRVGRKSCWRTCRLHS